MDPEIEALEQEDVVLSLEEISELKTARLALLAAEIRAQRERIYAEFDCHKAAIVADAALDESRGVTDNRNSLRTELHALDEAHTERIQGMDDFHQAQRVNIEKTSLQLLAIAKSQISQKIVQDQNTNFPNGSNFNVSIPFSTAPLPGAPTE